jgi:tetratricopeptide (TPR) repeat protein
MALEGCHLAPEAIPCYHESLSYYLQRKEFTNDTIKALYQSMHDACCLNDTETIKNCTKIADDPRMPQTPDLGSAYSDLGGWFVTHGETRRGIDYLLKAKAIYAHSPNFVAPQNLAGADAWLGRGYKDLGDYAKALELLRHAVFIYKGKTILVRAYTDLAEIAKKQSNSQDAALYEEKLKDALNAKDGG